MRIVLRTRYAGPRGTAGPGSPMDLPDDEAKALIDGGYAVPADKPKPKAEEEPKRKAAERETASEEQPETAAAPPPRRRRKTSASGE